MTAVDIAEGARWSVEEALVDARGHRRSPAQPRFCTPRDPSRATLGPELVHVIRMLGFEPMPWQVLVADIALELDADGDLVYREVVLIVPRQSGKTVLLLALRVWRALNGAKRWGGRQLTVYLSAKQKTAADMMITEDVPLLRQTRFGTLFKELRTDGEEGLTWRNGSRHRVLAATKKAGHSMRIDQVEVDEAFAVPDGRLEDGFRPTMITRRSPQMWIVSAIGDDTDEAQPSAWLWSKVEAGRARVSMILEGLAEGRSAPPFASCYFEWSAPEDADPADPETWWGCMPALGITQTVKAVRAEFEIMQPRTFKRAFLCIWAGSRKQPRLIDDAAWRSEQHFERDPGSEQAQFVSDLVLGVAASPGCEAVALVVAGRRGDGAPQVEVVKHAPGTTWVAEAVARLVRGHRVSVVMSKQSPAAALLPELARVELRDGQGEVEVEVEELSTEDVFRACEAWMLAFTQGNARHLGQGSLGAAVDLAVKKPYGNRFTLVSADFGGDVSPLEASALALWRALHPVAGVPRLRYI